MAIIQITPPESTPQSVGDYQAQNNLTDSRITNESYPVGSGNTVLKGAKFIIQGSTFIATADTPITGTESLYIKLVVTGTTAAPEYISDLTGVSWSDVYNGYYNISGEYVFFNEMLAFVTGVISDPKIIYNKIQSEITNQLLSKTSDVIFKNINVDKDGGSGGNLTVQGIITDKNGREVLALKVENQKDTIDGTGTSGSLSIVLTFSSAVEGIASVNVYNRTTSQNSTGIETAISGNDVTVTFYSISTYTYAVDVTAFVA